MITVDENNQGQNIESFLIKRLEGIPKGRVQKLIRQGKVRVNKRRIDQTYRLQLGDTIFISSLKNAQELVAKSSTPKGAELLNKEQQKQLQSLEQSIIFEDNRFLIINKPSGMAVHGGSGVSFGVIEGMRALRPNAPYLELVHRLDRDTSGCLVIAKRRSALRAFQKQQQEGHVTKHYLALVKGQWQGGNKKIDKPLLKTVLKSGDRVVSVNKKGKNAISLFSPVQKLKEATLMRIKLITGRTHQIRVHALDSGSPIAGDSKYGDESFNKLMTKAGINRLFLHAESISFTLPDIEPYNIQAPLDPKLEQTLRKLQSL